MVIAATATVSPPMRKAVIPTTTTRNSRRAVGVRPELHELPRAGSGRQKHGIVGRDREPEGWGVRTRVRQPLARIRFLEVVVA